MRVPVQCFGRLRELLAPEVAVELTPPARVADLWRVLRERYPALAAYEGSIAIAVNECFASPETPLAEADRVALLPPVSGGAGDEASDETDAKDPAPSEAAEPALPLVTAHARLQREPIDSAALLAAIKAPEDGAVCLFDGIVRNHSRNRRTLYLEYDAYAAMAAAQMEQLAAAALANFAIREAKIVHRIGRLEIGETSVLIAVASAHRAAAFEACRWLIDNLKKTVPIWKKEFFADGAVWADGEPFPPELRL
jgi:molybdopterin synthase catalytic subunit/molybdopterin converting factor small subunit